MLSDACKAIKDENYHLLWCLFSYFRKALSWDINDKYDYNDCEKNLDNYRYL